MHRAQLGRREAGVDGRGEDGHSQSARAAGEVALVRAHQRHVDSVPRQVREEVGDVLLAAARGTAGGGDEQDAQAPAAHCGHTLRTTAPRGQATGTMAV